MKKTSLSWLIYGVAKKHVARQNINGISVSSKRKRSGVWQNKRMLQQRIEKQRRILYRRQRSWQHQHHRVTGIPARQHRAVAGRVP